MADPGRDEDAVARSDLDLAPIKTDNHPAGQNHLFVLDGVVAVARNPTPGFKCEVTGDEVRDADLGAQQDFDAGPPAAGHDSGFNGVERANGW